MHTQHVADTSSERLRAFILNHIEVEQTFRWNLEAFQPPLDWWELVYAARSDAQYSEYLLDAYSVQQ